MSSAGRPHGEFNISIDQQEDVVLIRPSGELDLATADALQQAVENEAAMAQPVVVDLGGLTFMDVAGLRVLLGAKGALGERLTILSGPPQVQRIFSLTGTEGELGLGSPTADPGTAQAAANVMYLRELWATYRAGGAQALSQRLSSDDVPAAPATGRGWGGSELSGFWSRAESKIGASQIASCHIEEIGNNVLVASEASRPERARVIWTLYLFEGRTLLRALTFDSEDEARAYATTTARDRHVSHPSHKPSPTGP